MLIEDFLTRVPIWVALICYTASVVLFSRSKFAWARWAWSMGCLCYLIHVIFAFQVHYQWSHAIAVKETAAQTEELTGIKTTAGIYVNYLFTLVWFIDAVWWWRVGLQRYSDRPRAIGTTLHLFFVFMIFNGAVVFATGPARWLGVGVLLVIISNWILVAAGGRSNVGLI